MGWIIISLLLPIFTPFLFYWALKGFAFPSAPKVIQMIKDGQLGWVGAGYAIGAAIAFLCASSAIAAVGTMLPVTYPKPAGIVWMKHFEIMIKSVGLTAASALLYGLVHYGTVGVQTLQA